MKQSNNVHDLELYRRLGGDTVLVEKLVKRFATNLPILIIRLTLALRNQDRLRASTQIKMLKEVANSLSATGINAALQQLEHTLATSENNALPATIHDVEHIAQQFTAYLQLRFPGLYESA